MSLRRTLDTAKTPLRRVLAEYIETWDGGHGYPGFCICQVIEDEGKPVRIKRGKAMYLRDMPEMGDWIEIFNRASSNLRARAWYEITMKKRKKAA